MNGPLLTLRRLQPPKEKPAPHRVVDVRTPEQHQQLLWRRIVEQTGHPEIRAHLAQLVQDYGIPPRDPVALARAALHHAQTKITYLREHPETFQAPTRTLKWRIGDCDDLSGLLCATLRSAKIPCRLAFVGWVPRTKRPSKRRIPFRHVYAEAYLAPLKRWVALEGVRKVPAGWSAATAYLRKGFRVRKRTLGDHRDKMVP